MINRPQPGEYAPFSAAYIKMVPDANVIELLEKQMDLSYDLFYNLSDGKANYTYAEGKWTVKQVVGHLSDTERTFAYRLLYFSRAAVELPGFDQDIFVDNARFNESSIQYLASEFRAVRQASLYLIRALTDDQLTKTGIASGYNVSVRALIYLVAGHELYHLHILKERYGF